MRGGFLITSLKWSESMEFKGVQGHPTAAQETAQSYSAPTLTVLGSVTELTQGGGIRNLPDVALVTAGSGAG
jgi:hypothetical protein